LPGWLKIPRGEPKAVTSARRNACRPPCKSVRCCCPHLTKIGTCRQILVKLSNIKFNGKPFIDSGVAACRLMDGQTDMAKQSRIFWNFSCERA
jgi:hypothetical protein